MTNKKFKKLNTKDNKNGKAGFLYIFRIKVSVPAVLSLQTRRDSTGDSGLNGD